MVYYDEFTGTQVPLSRRGWAGTYQPEQFKITPLLQTKAFGGHMPGGGVSEPAGELSDRWIVSGRLEIDCMGCHSADPAQDSSVSPLSCRAWIPITRRTCLRPSCGVCRR